MNHAIILASGKGERINKKIKSSTKNFFKKDKMLLEINQKPLIYFTLISLHDHEEIDSIIITANSKNKKEIEKLIKIYHFPKVKKIILGGVTRQKSLEKGIEALEKTQKNINKNEIILIQNGANPLPSYTEITQSIKKTKQTGACIVGQFVSATVKEIKGRHVLKTHDRKKIFTAETPQSAKYFIMKKAIKNAQKKKLKVTDEAMLFEEIKQKVAYTESSENNFKITNYSDYLKLKTILGDSFDKFIVGIGQDSHVFEKTKKGLALGGVKFKNELKLKANSDGDVILHAIFNALSQAIGQKSLGFYADKKCKLGIKNSKKYLEEVLKKIKKKNLEINNLGIMIECKTPKIDPISEEIKKSMSKILDIPKIKIGITATTGENVTEFGKGKGVQCFAIVSLKNN